MKKSVFERRSFCELVVFFSLLVNVGLSTQFAHAYYFEGWIYTDGWAQFWMRANAAIVPIASVVGFIFHILGTTSRRTGKT